MKQIIATELAPKAIGPYSQGVKVVSGQIHFFSGQIPLDPSTMQIVGGTAAEQCRRVMQNIGSLLAAIGAGYEHIVKTTLFLKDMNDFSSVNEVYGSFFKADPPARSTVEVSRLPKDVLIEIEMIVVI